MNNENFEPNYTVINEEFAAAEKRKNGFSVTALVLGIVCIVCCCINFISLVCAALAIIFAILDKKKNGSMNGMALAGLICGIIGAVICVYFIIDGIINPVEMDENFWEEYYAMLEELMNNTEGGGEVLFRALPLR